MQQPNRDGESRSYNACLIDFALRLTAMFNWYEIAYFGCDIEEDWVFFHLEYRTLSYETVDC